MENKEPSKELGNLEFDKDNLSNDYQFLVLKLKNIKENITLLEKNFLKQ